MENLKKAVSKLITTVMVVDKSLEDRKVNLQEKMQIAVSAVAWAWIFKNFRAVVEDFMGLTEETKKELNEYIKTTLDLRNDVAEAVVEQALEIILSLTDMMVKTREAVTT